MPGERSRRSCCLLAGRLPRGDRKMAGWRQMTPRCQLVGYGPSPVIELGGHRFLPSHRSHPASHPCSRALLIARPYAQRAAGRTHAARRRRIGNFGIAAFDIDHCDNCRPAGSRHRAGTDDRLQARKILPLALATDRCRNARVHRRHLADQQKVQGRPAALGQACRARTMSSPARRLDSGLNDECASRAAKPHEPSACRSHSSSSPSFVLILIARFVTIDS